MRHKSYHPNYEANVGMKGVPMYYCDVCFKRLRSKAAYRQHRCKKQEEKP